MGREVYMTGFWEDEEVKALFCLVEKYRAENKTIKDAFLQHGKLYARKPNSVRNYYYHEIDNLLKDGQRAQKLSIDLSLHKKANIVYFSKEEEKNLMQEIKDMTQKGMSVRKACLTLAGGDVDKLLRYQNKYRNFIAHEKNEKSENVITFQKPCKGLSDSEVQSLFMGLVRLVKKNAVLEGEEHFKIKLNQANDKLRKALFQLQAQAREIDALKDKYLQLKKENAKLVESLIVSRCDKAEKLREKFTGHQFKKDEVLGE